MSNPENGNRSDDGKRLVRVMLAPGSGPLIVASAMGHVPIVKQLLAAPGISLDQRNSAGETAMMLASRYGHMEVVELLCEAGASTEGALDEAIASLVSQGTPMADINAACAAGRAAPRTPAGRRNA